MDVLTVNSSTSRGEMQMAERIKAGTILIEEGTLLPESVRIESAPYSKGWRLVNFLGGSELDQAIGKAGWTLFYIAGEVGATVFGFDEERVLRRAVNRVLANLKSENFNCLEITQVAARSFLGIPYVTVSAHPRHIQESMVLLHAKRLLEWDQAKLAAA